MFLIPDDSWEIKNTEKKGRGVFAKKEIQPGKVIGDYLGQVIKEEEEDKYDLEEEFYAMYYTDDAIVYPDIQKPGIHILNHSCTPNCWMTTYKGHTLYFSLRRIFPGEELTVSYLLSPEDKDCNPCTHLCNCGSIICSGTMHLPQKRYDEWVAFDNEEEKKTETEPASFGEELPKLSSYPREILDNPIYTLFGNSEIEPHIITDSVFPSISKLRQMIRESGKTLEFSSINIKVFGIMDGFVTSQPLK
jgi:hypothetical protein